MLSITPSIISKELSSASFFALSRYDTNVEAIIRRITVRLASSINDYKTKISNNADDDESRDVPFGTLYQDLLNANKGQDIISLLLHLDGIGITQSSKLKLWMFSGAIIELPPKIRYRRFNMVLISIWIGYSEPAPQLWLNQSIQRLKALKTRGMSLIEENRG